MTDKDEVQETFRKLVVSTVIFSFVLPFVLVPPVNSYVGLFTLAIAIWVVPFVLLASLVYWFVARSLLLSDTAKPWSILAVYWVVFVPLMSVFLYYAVLPDTSDF